MRCVAFLPLVFLSLVAGRLHAAAPVAPAGELIDQVWAGHPVGFAFLVDRGHQWIAYYDAERKMTVIGRRIGAAHWTKIQPAGVPVPARKRDSNVIAWDSHNYLRLALDRDGHVHLSGNMHVDPLVYYRSREPFDVATLERIDRMTGERELRCTYPVFFKNAAGDLMFRYRDGSSGNGSDLYNLYDPATRTWRRLLETPLLDGEQQRNAYSIEPRLGPDGRFHLVWMWRDTPDCATNHTISYARSRDFVHWENSRGEPITLPITLARGDVIDPAKPGEGLINMTFNLGFDAEHRPVVVYHRYDADKRSQTYAARPGPRGWDVQQISNWNFTWAFSGGGSIASEVRLAPPRLEADGTLLVDYATAAAGSGRWRLDGGTLRPLAALPVARTAGAAPALRWPKASPGMEVMSITVRHGGRRYLLRWETLPRNRDRPRASAPPPSELRLYELPDDETVPPTHIGS